MYMAGMACMCGEDCASCGGAGLGQYGGGSQDLQQVELNGIEDAAQFVPVVGPIASDIVQIFAQAASLIGSGRREADIIVPTQNQLMDYLGRVTNNLVAGGLTVPQLQAYLWIVEQVGIKFRQFVSNTSQFRDGRASQQALNTIMPYIDGTCGYYWPPPMNPTQTNCLHWGAGTPGGDGTDGMVGAISRYILQLGGRATPVPLLTQGPGMPGLYPPLAGLPNIPQAGTINPNVPPQLQPGTPPLTAGIGGLDMSQLLPVGALAFLAWAVSKHFSGGHAA